MCAAIDSEDSKTIFTGSYDGRICAWDVSTGDASVVVEEDANVGNLTRINDKILYTVHKEEDILKQLDMKSMETR